MLIRNFLFHRVNPVRDIMWDPMDVKLFEKCIGYIMKNFEVISTSQLLTINKKTSKKLATISFDDGYKDNLEYAAPILQKYRCPASFYIVINCAEHNNLIFTHIVEHIFQSTNKSMLNMSFDFLPVELKIKDIKTKKERIGYAKKLIPYIKKITSPQRKIIIDKIQEMYDDCELPKLMMNWQDIIQLSNAGFNIGSHTVTHDMLGTIINSTTMQWEIEESKKIIQQHTGVMPDSISYPVNSYNSSTIGFSKAAGYKLGFAVKQKLYDTEMDNFFEIPRIELYNEPWWKTKMRLTNNLERIRQIIRH
jgi:peptidoglycan/xylan/chitin deacetylase (PgdA/CDA1 family)